MSNQTEPTVTTATDATAISGVAFVSSYVDDFPTAFTFYNQVLGLEKKFDMGDDACFFRLGTDAGLFLQGGNLPAQITDTAVRSSFTLNVPSASAMYAKLREAGARFVHAAPMDMGGGNHWFQFFDPAGNILEILGGE